MIYLDTETHRPVSEQFVEEAVNSGVSRERFIEAYPTSSTKEKERLASWISQNKTNPEKR